MTKRHRSAVTGEYVTAEQAKADPDRTVSEVVPERMQGKVVLECERPVTAEQLAQLGEWARVAFPDGAVVLDHGIRVSRRDELDEMQERIEALEAAVAELRGRE